MPRDPGIRDAALQTQAKLGRPPLWLREAGRSMHGEKDAWG
jgi:hypothetical protein